MVSFENKPFFNAQTSQYGTYVSDTEELKNFVLGTDSRIEPAMRDTVHPSVGNSILYDHAESVHHVLDAWEPSSETKVIQIAGWGEETIAGIDYVSLKDVTEHISYKPRMVIDGDATVVVPSALWMSDSNPNVERWWADLLKVNKDSIISRTQHKDILEIPTLRDFIKSKIKDQGLIDLDNIIVNNTSTLTSNDTRRLHYTLHSPLTLGITDAQGRYTGMDPVTHEIKQEIPGVTYMQIGEVQFLSVPAGIAYTLTLQGYEDGFFSLDVDEQTGNEITESISFEGISSSTLTLVTMNITPDSEVETSELKIDQDGNGSTDKIYHVVEGKTQAAIVAPVVSGSGALVNSGGSSTSVAPTQIAETLKVETKKEEKIEEKKEVVKNAAVVTKLQTESKSKIASVQKKKTVPARIATQSVAGGKKVVMIGPQKPTALAVETKVETKVKPEMLSASVITSSANVGFWGTIKKFIYNIFH